MRVTERLRTDELLRNLQAHAWRLSQAYEKLSTQQEIVRPSDDPAGAGSVMRLTAHIQALEQTQDAIYAAQSFLDASNAALTGAADIVTRVKTLAVRAANSTLSPSDRAGIAEEVNQLLESLLQAANRSADGRYLFSGTRTDAAPFAVERDPNGDITTITYQGSTTPLTVPLERNRSVTVGVTGDQAFLDSGVLAAVRSFRDTLRNDAGLSDQQVQAALQQELGNLTDAEKALLAMVGELGSRSTHLDLTGDQTQGALTRARETLSRLRDADVAEIAVELQKEEMVFQALLATAGRIMSLSLVDYLD